MPPIAYIRRLIHLIGETWQQSNALDSAQDY